MVQHSLERTIAGKYPSELNVRPMIDNDDLSKFRMLIKSLN